MTKYELINSNIDVVVSLVKNNLTKVDIIKHLEIYETFHSLQGTKTERYSTLGRMFNLQPDTVRKFINNLNKKVK